MMGQQCRTESLFYYFRLEDQVPETHLLRLIDRYIDFSFVRGPARFPRVKRVEGFSERIGQLRRSGGAHVEGETSRSVIVACATRLDEIDLEAEHV